jgi:flagellar hook-associated protein 2
MPTISSAGVGSGLDVPGLVEKLVAAEGEPVRTRLDRKEAELQAGLSALGIFKGAVSEFQASFESLRNSDAFGAMNVVSDDEESLTATASSAALPGDYEIEVVQLAQAQKLSSEAFDSDIKPLGSGSLAIQLGRYDNGSFITNSEITPANITIDASNNSLRGIAEAINQVGAGVRASVVNDGTGYRLVLSALQEGSNNMVRIVTRDDDGDDTDLNGLSNLAFDLSRFGNGAANLIESVPARDAVLRIDGLEVTRSGNEINDVLEGVLLELHPGAAGKRIGISVTLDTDSVTSAINEFVTRYNSLIDSINELTGYDPETGVAGPLSGDASVRGVAAQIRRVMSSNFGSINQSYDSLASIGIDTQRDGKLSLDDGRLQQAIETNLQEVVQLFAVAGSASDPLVKYRGADAATPAGAYELVVTGLASQGFYRGQAVRPDLLVLEDGQNRLRLQVDGVRSDRISLAPGTYRSLYELAAALESAINSDSRLGPAGSKVEVSVEDNRLVLTSAKYGSNSAVELLEVDAGLAAVSGLAIGEGHKGENASGTFDGEPANGNGRVLTAEGRARGLQVEILGGSTGARGTVYFSNGIAARLGELIASFTAHDGLFDSRTEGFNNRIEDIGRQREQLNRKLERSEQRYLKQFSSLDALLGKMRSTSEYLGQQLASLPGANRKDK